MATALTRPTATFAPFPVPAVLRSALRALRVSHPAYAEAEALARTLAATPPERRREVALAWHARQPRYL